MHLLQIFLGKKVQQSMAFWFSTVTFSSIALEIYNFSLFKDGVFFKKKHKLCALPLNAEFFSLRCENLLFTFLQRQKMLDDIIQQPFLKLSFFILYFCWVPWKTNYYLVLLAEMCKVSDKKVVFPFQWASKRCFINLI